MYSPVWTQAPVPPLALKPSPWAVSFLSSAAQNTAHNGKHGSFVKWNTCANSTYVNAWVHIRAGEVLEEETLDGAARNMWPLFFSRRKRSRRRAGIHYCHDYGGSCLLLVKFRLLYACCGALLLHRCIPGCLRAAITYSVFRRRDAWGCFVAPLSLDRDDEQFP